MHTVEFLPHDREGCINPVGLGKGFFKSKYCPRNLYLKISWTSIYFVKFKHYQNIAQTISTHCNSFYHDRK